MGKPKVRLDGFAPTLANDAKRTGVASKGSVGSRTWDNSTSAKRPTNKAKGTNAKLIGSMTSLNFDGGDYLDLSTAEEFGWGEKWFWVFAFVDLDTTTDCILAYSSDYGAYLGIEAGGAGLVYKANDHKGSASEISIATNNTNNSSVSHTFGSDVEVLVLARSASSNTLKFYNIDGDLIAQDSTSLNALEWNLDRIGANNSTSTEFVGELIDAKFYNGSDCPPITAASLQAIGNNYKQLKD